MKIQRSVKLFLLILTEGILILASGLAGMYNERIRILQEEEAETVTEIAVVNLDEGVYENDRICYYSNELMDLESDRLVPESMEAARQGIHNGSYAAYILIPADFSKNAVSINSIPEKSRLSFAVNPNLREDVSRLTMADIKNFEIDLNTNMSYMYVQAILEEFHAVQDSAGTIMQNDRTEMERLNDVQPDALMGLLDSVETEWIDPDIEDVDFQDVFEANSRISQELRDNYDDFAERGMEKLEEVKSKESTVAEGMDDFFDIVADIDIGKDEEGKTVYEQGFDSLSEYLSEYELKFLKKRNAVYEKIDAMTYITPLPEPGDGEDGDTGEKPGDGEDDGSAEDSGEGDVITEPEQPTVKPIPKIIADIIQESLNKANARIEDKNAENEKIVGSAHVKLNNMSREISDIQQMIEARLDAGEEIGIEEWQSVQEQLGNLSGYLGLLEEELNSIETFDTMVIEEIYDEEIVKEEFQVLADMIQELPQVELQEYEKIFEEEILSPLEEEIQNENARVQEEGGKYLGTVEEYMEELAAFDPYEYYDAEKIAQLEGSFAENLFDLEEKTYKSQGEYLEFAYNSAELSNENMEQMQDNLQEAYDETEENVIREFDLAKQYRQAMNETNTEILGDFSKKLPYTRIGNLEYVQAYDYMVKPIVMSDVSVTGNRVLLFQNYDALKNILMVMMVIWILTAGGMMGSKVYRSFTDNLQEE